MQKFNFISVCGLVLPRRFLTSTQTDDSLFYKRGPVKSIQHLCWCMWLFDITVQSSNTPINSSGTIATVWWFCYRKKKRKEKSERDIDGPRKPRLLQCPIRTLIRTTSTPVAPIPLVFPLNYPIQCSMSVSPLPLSCLRTYDRWGTTCTALAYAQWWIQGANSKKSLRYYYTCMFRLILSNFYWIILFRLINL